MKKYDKDSFHIKIGWVKPCIIESLKGITVGALRKKKESNILIEGVHWHRAPDNVIYYHFENIDQFLGA
jgi:hypothetical protein